MTEGGELERTLGFVEAMTLGGGTMIGAGIFILPGIAAASAGPASSISYAIAGGVALLAALSLSELATGMPIAGGSYHYVNRALGGLFGAVVGWGMWTGLMFASAFYMIGFGQYLVAPLPGIDGRGFVVLLGLLGLALLLGVNYYGTEESSRLQNLMIGTETAIIIVFVAAGVFFIDPANLEPFAPTGAPGVLATTGIVFISFLGFEIIATVAGEIKDPGRTIPTTMLLSVVSVTGLYVLVMLVTTGVVPIETIVDSPIPVSDVASVSLGAIGVAAIVFAAVIAAISSSNSSVLAASRVVYAMGRDGLVSEWFNASHPRYFTPHRAIGATGAVTAALVLLGLQVEAIVALLAEAASFTFLLTYALVHVAVVVFRRADPDEYDPDFRIPGRLYPAVPVLGVVMTFVVISQMAPVVVGIGLGIVALGLVWYAAYGRRRVGEPGLLRAAIAGKPAVDYRVVVPVANPGTQGGLLRIAAASAHANAAGGAAELVAVDVVEGDPADPALNLEAERAEHQAALFEAARGHAEDMDVRLRTRAHVAPDVATGVLEVLEEEAADHLVLGWDGRLGEGGHAFGGAIDPLVEEATGDVSLVRGEGGGVGAPAALVAPGRNAPAVARRARELASLAGRTPTLVTVTDDEAEGESFLQSVAEEAGLPAGGYETVVVVDDDVAEAARRAVAGFETVCVGLAHQADHGSLGFGPVTEAVAERAEGTLVLVRRP